MESLESRLLLSLDLYVALSGSDSNPGTIDQPFATVGKARQYIRDLITASALPTGGVTVNLRGGVYLRTKSFDLYASDSGTADKPIVWRAYPGETVRFVGATAIPPSWFSILTSTSPEYNRLSPTARGHVCVVDLKAHGITDYGTLSNRAGATWNASAPMELFCNDQPMQLGRYPNDGNLQTGAVTSPTRFGYTDQEVERWTTAEDPWFSGMFGTYWFNSLVGGHVNTTNDTITLNAQPPYGVAADHPYYAFNLLEEIDTPGEYYINRTTGKLYFWAPGYLAGCDMYVSTVNDYMLHLIGASNITIEGITFEMSRAGLAAIDNGSNNHITDCVLRNAGRYGISISGTNNGIENSQVSDVGETAVTLSGGNRQTLQAGGNYVRNCDLYQWGRWVRSTRTAVSVDTVGQIVANNDIHDGPSGAIWYTGNNHLLEYNDIWGVCTDIQDAGVIYAGRDWGYRGNVIRYNMIHNVHNVFSSGDLYGVYFDDAVSQADIYGNLFYDIDGWAQFNAGGRDNYWTNNMIVKCVGGHLGDRRGVTIINSIPGDDCNFLEKLENASGGDFHSGAWGQQYPQLLAIPYTFDELGDLKNPGGTTFDSNWGWDNQTWMKEGRFGGLSGAFQWYASIADNVADEDPLFVDEAAGNFNLQANSPVHGMIPSWQDIPVNWIGVQEDGERPPVLPHPAPPTNGAIVVDDASSGFGTTGTWTPSAAVDGYAGGSVESIDAGASASWRPTIGQAGSYAVYVWWSAKQSDGTPLGREGAAQYTVYYQGGSKTVTVDQNGSYGQWVYLGTFDFAADGTGYVSLGRGSDDGVSMAADAVKFAPAVVTVDNTSSGFVTTGLWNVSTAVDAYGTNSLSALNAGASALWRPTISQAGSYTVYAWWSAKRADGTYFERDHGADYTVQYAGGSATVTVDQSTRSGQWVPLGTYTFDAGTTGYVSLLRDSSDGNATVADAVRFVWNPPKPKLPGDANEDGTVNFDDYLLLEADFGWTGSVIKTDFNCDGRVDFSDYLILEANFGTSA